MRFRQPNRKRHGSHCRVAARDDTASKPCPSDATALTAEQLRALLVRLRASDECHILDLVDPITLLIATGLRESELLGLLWSDFDPDAGTLSVTGKVFRRDGARASTQ